MKAWINGNFVGWDQANVSLLSHSFGRGSAVFEVADIVPARNGPAYFGLIEHIERLVNSAKLVFMELPYSRQEIVDAFIETAKENQAQNGLAKLFAYFPSIEFAAVPKNKQVDMAVFCVDYALFDIKQEDLSRQVRSGVCSYRKIHPDTLPVHSKVCGNYVNPYLAETEVMNQGYDDVIIIDMQGRVSEGGTSNVFFVKDGRLLTPTLENVLAGITRMAIIEVAGDNGITVEETDIGYEALYDFDEAFYCGSIQKIRPIETIDGRAVGNACPGPVTSRLIDAMAEVYGGTNPAYGKWLTYIS